MIVLFYSMTALLIVSGLLVLGSAFRKRTAKEILLGKTLPLTGRGSKQHLMFLGVVLVLFGMLALIKAASF